MFWNQYKAKPTVSTLLIPAVLATVLLLSGCNSGGGGDTGKTGFVGIAYSFNGSIAGGTVELWSFDGDLVNQESLDINPTGGFHAEFDGDHPVTDVEGLIFAVAAPQEAHHAGQALPTPARMRALIDYLPDDELAVVRITPLTSLVTAYALQTGSTAETAERAIAEYLGFVPGMTQDLFPEQFSVTSPFCFTRFANAWRDSGLDFELFLDTLVDEARSGRKRSFARLTDTGDAFDYKGIAKYIIGKITEGTIGFDAGEGIGWIMSLLEENKPDEVEEKLRKIDEKLDRIYQTIIISQINITALLQEIRVEIKAESLHDPVAGIKVLSKNLNLLPKIRDQETARKMIKDIRGYAIELEKWLESMHMTLATPIAGKDFYTILGEYHLAKFDADPSSINTALQEYIQVFSYLNGIQLQGLILRVELAHFTKDPATRKQLIDIAVNEHLKNIAAQTERFLYGAELLIVYAYPNGGASIDYDLPLSALKNSPYTIIDSVAADATNAPPRLLTVRLLWDTLIDTRYPWSDNAPQDYNQYYSFMRERINQLEAPESLVVTVKPSNRQEPVFARSNQYGSVKVFSHTRAGREPARAALRRYQFDLSMSTLGSITTNHVVQWHAKSGGTGVFNIVPEEIYVPGSVGRELISTNPSVKTKLEPSTDTISSLTLLAWLPESYILVDGQIETNEINRHHGPIPTNIPQEQPDGHRHYIGNNFRSTENYLSAEAYCEKYKGCQDKELHFRPRVTKPRGLSTGAHYVHRPTEWAAVNPNDDRLRYGDSFILRATREQKNVHNQTWFKIATGIWDSSHMIYALSGGENNALAKLTVEPIPSFVGMFIDPRRSDLVTIYPRRKDALFLKTQRGYLRIQDWGESVWSDGEVKPKEQRWFFD